MRRATRTLPRTIEKLRDRFRSGDRRAKSRLLHQLGNRRPGDEIAIHPFVRFERWKIRGIKRLVQIDLSTEFLIGNDPAALRPGAGGDADTIHVRRAGKNRVVIAKENTVSRE